MMKKPLVIGHRGAAAILPENTMPSFELALNKVRADMVEFDVQTTRDGVPVILHDARLDRTTNGHGYLAKTTLTELQKLDAGYFFDPKGQKKFPERGKKIQVPTLEQLLSSFPSSSFAVEIKSRSRELTKSVAILVKKYGAENRSIIGSKHEVVSEEMRKNFPGISRFLSRKEICTHLFHFRTKKKTVKKDPLAVASIPTESMGYKLDQPAWIDFLHEREIRVFYWTINDPSKAKSLAEGGADGIITDNPEIMLRAFGRP